MVNKPISIGQTCRRLFNCVTTSESYCSSLRTSWYTIWIWFAPRSFWYHSIQWINLRFRFALCSALFLSSSSATMAVLLQGKRFFDDVLGLCMFRSKNGWSRAHIVYAPRLPNHFICPGSYIKLTRVVRQPTTDTIFWPPTCSRT